MVHFVYFKKYTKKYTNKIQKKNLSSSSLNFLFIFFLPASTIDFAFILNDYIFPGHFYKIMLSLLPCACFKNLIF